MWLTYSSDITQQDFTIIALCERKIQFNNLLQNDIVPHYSQESSMENMAWNRVGQEQIYICRVR